MKNKKHIVLASIIVIVIVGACMLFLARLRVRKEMSKTTFSSISDVPREHWAKLAETKIFFGHQSVGYNIIEGIKDIAADHDYIKLNIVETKDLPSNFDEPCFSHAQVGRNMDPASKIDGFVRMMDEELGNKVDIAFLKFCYIDIMRNSKPQEIFNSYSNAINDLSERYPETTFLHVTVPLKSAPIGFKNTMKECVKVLIRKPGIFDDNSKRQQYNQLLNETYAESEHFFDLATVEATGLDGRKCYTSRGSQKVPLMAKEYTYDGGHLNKQGQRAVAEQLLIRLAELANQK
jgi:lysophospholipase L1-like esterase